MKFLIYGKPDCPFCEKAKQLLSLCDYKFVYRELGTDFTKEELLVLVPEAKTYPQIWVNYENSTDLESNGYIGGYNELDSFIYGSFMKKI